MSADFDQVKAAVQAGRVAHTGFLEPDEAAELAARLRAANLAVHVSGGFAGARRRVLTAFPETIPEATTPLKALFTASLQDADKLRVALRQALEADQLGDIVRHQAGLSVVVLAKTNLPALRFEGREISFETIPLERLASGTIKRQQVIVPSLRVDALGAKAFGVSRSYFSKGIAAGNVLLNGKRVGKAADAEAGDEIYAEGLGRCQIVMVQGETRKGNLKLVLEVEK